ncbi:MAG TPA: protein kinase [Candidatus Polarisedimenticolia bacterium]|nr:protein kinase [Candidatus Polarisedimenticolia bacterium]
MAINPGTRIGPYEIAAPLGAGGMGEVYRARDARLGREVAIKVLPESFAADPERLARLEREARLLASLNHSGIAHLYGFETATFEDGRSGHFLVMELAEGEDLAERMKRGAIPIDEALPIAKQIAEALEEAHEKGIVHRDLKPANVMLTPDGKVKVLDFGLAKAYSNEPGGGGSSDLSQSPTLAHAGTMAGMILGTAAYMSPEQARGKPLDKRADIWAFGVVLFEMLAGTRLFYDETVSDTLAAVLRQEIDWSALPPSTPSGVRHLLAQCLERDPRKRLRDIGDARIAIDEAASGTLVETGRSGAAQTRSRPAWHVPLAIGVALALGLAAGWALRRPSISETEPAMRWALAIPDGMTLSTADFPQIALSEDGRLQVVVVVDESSTPRLLVRRDDEFEARLLPDSERAVSPFLSPDGAWVGFFRDNALFKIPVFGGPPVRLATTSGQVRGGTWSKDGFIYISADTNVSLSRVPEGGGELTAVTRLDESRDERTHRWPQALPGGDAVLFTCDTQASTEFYDDARIEIVRPATGERKVLVEGSSQGWYSPSGHLVFARAGSLYALRLDPRSFEVRGSPVQVARGVATDVGSGAVQFAIAQNGAALWTPGGSTATYQVVWVDRSLAETPAPITPAPYNELALSPDGKKLALIGGQGGVSDLWIADLERGSMTRLTFGEYVLSPVWTPDSSRIAYGTRVQGRKDNLWWIVWKPADGSREAEILVEGRRFHLPTSFSPDGKALIFDALSDDARTRDIMMLPLEGPRAPRGLVVGPFIKSEGNVSPNGRWLAYVSDEGGQPSVFVRPFPTGEGRWQISTPSGFEPQWSRDGRELFYRVDTALYRVPVQTSPSFSAGRPERLFDRVASGGSGTRTYTPSPDGSKFMTFRSSQGVGSLRTLYLDLGFATRLRTLAPEK